MVSLQAGAVGGFASRAQCGPLPVNSGNSGLNPYKKTADSERIAARGVRKPCPVSELRRTAFFGGDVLERAIQRRWRSMSTVAAGATSPEAARVPAPTTEAEASRQPSDEASSAGHVPAARQRVPLAAIRRSCVATWCLRARPSNVPPRSGSAGAHRTSRLATLGRAESMRCRTRDAWFTRGKWGARRETAFSKGKHRAGHFLGLLAVEKTRSASGVRPCFGPIRRFLERVEC